MNKKGFAGIIVVVIIVVILLCLFFIRVPYDTFPDNTPNAVCVNGELKLQSSGNQMGDIIYSKIAGMSEFSNSLGCSINAGQELSDITSQIECIKGVPTVVCKTQLYKAILMGRIKFVTKDTLTVAKTQFNIIGYNFTESQFDMTHFCTKEVCGKNQRASGTNNAKSSGWVECSCVINEGSYAEGTFIVEDFYIDTNSGERITLEETGRRNNIEIQNKLEEWRTNKPSVEEVTKCISDNFVSHPLYSPDMNSCSNFDLTTFKNKCNIKEFDKTSESYGYNFYIYGNGDKNIILSALNGVVSAASIGTDEHSLGNIVICN